MHNISNFNNLKLEHLKQDPLNSINIIYTYILNFENINSKDLSLFTFMYLFIY